MHFIIVRKCLLGTTSMIQFTASDMSLHYTMLAIEKGSKGITNQPQL